MGLVVIVVVRTGLGCGGWCRDEVGSPLTTLQSFFVSRWAGIHLNGPLVLGYHLNGPLGLGFQSEKSRGMLSVTRVKPYAATAT